MLKSESALENKMPKILWDFEIQTDHPVSARRFHLVWINKKKELVITWILLFQLTTDYR